MKRVLLITIPFMIGLMIGIFFLGKEVIFGKFNYHIPENYKIEIEKCYSDENFIFVNLYDEEGYKVNYYKVPKKQKQKLVEERIIKIDLGDTYPFFLFLYAILVIGFLVYFIQWCFSIGCCNPSENHDKEWYSQCMGLCDKRCALYNKITKYDLTPHKNRFKGFWGYK